MNGRTVLFVIFLLMMTFIGLSFRFHGYEATPSLIAEGSVCTLDQDSKWSLLAGLSFFLGIRSQLAESGVQDNI